MKESERRPTGKLAAFFCLVIGWIALDQFTKSLFAGAEPGAILAGPFAGLIDIRLVHNTGGAWGIFSGNTMALGLFSIVVCVVLAGYYLFNAKRLPVLQTVAFALIVAGGIGNAIDRFAQGYVTDFIEFSFIDFPVFNVADIGVTCGFALLIVSMLFQFRTEGSTSGEGGDDGAPAEADAPASTALAASANDAPAAPANDAPNSEGGDE